MREVLVNKYRLATGMEPLNLIEEDVLRRAPPAVTCLIRASLSNTFKREDASDGRLGCRLAFTLHPVLAGDFKLAGRIERAVDDGGGRLVPGDASKEGLMDATELKEEFERQAEWRRQKAAEHADDSRNAEAAALFD